MYLKKAFIRFYKSFNDDFLRKNDERVNTKPWNMIGNTFYPYIEVPELAKEIEAVKNNIQNLRRAYKLDTNMNQAIHDYSGFQMGLERIKYAGLLDSQDKDLENDSVLEEAFNFAQLKKVAQNEQTQIINEQETPERVEASDHSVKDNLKRKSNPRK